VSTAASVGERDQVARDAAIVTVFGSGASVARDYAEQLVTTGITRGVIGPREADRVWERHLFNSAALAPLIPFGVQVVDLGSGAGLPGIPLAIARPDLRMTLLEPLQRRVDFLRDCLASLDLGNVEVVRGRAEDRVTPPADIVVARAVAPLTRLATLSFDLLVGGGELLALKGATAAAEVAQLRAELGVSAVSAEVVSLPAPGGPATVIRVARPPAVASRRAQRGRQPR
jgi:16S rRNA (guanine527-N7)-methyltransferase